MILITGASGQLGQALTALCQRRGIACHAYSRQQLDICNQARVKAYFDLESFDCVINCAAYTAVDAAALRFRCWCRSVHPHSVRPASAVPGQYPGRMPPAAARFRHIPALHLP